MHLYQKTCNVETKAANFACRWFRKCVEVTCGAPRHPSELPLTHVTPHGWSCSGSWPLYTGLLPSLPPYADGLSWLSWPGSAPFPSTCIMTLQEYLMMQRLQYEQLYRHQLWLDSADEYSHNFETKRRPFPYSAAAVVKSKQKEPQPSQINPHSTVF